jgi:hypothetical protein
MAACLAWPPTLVMVAHGNPVMWEVAFLAVGCVTAGPAVLVLIKPTLAPFALVGVRSRRWWIALGGFAALSAAFGAMWLDWLQALLNSDGSIVYSVQQWPILALPTGCPRRQPLATRGRRMRQRRGAERPARPDRPFSGRVQEIGYRAMWRLRGGRVPLSGQGRRHGRSMTPQQPVLFSPP